MDAKIKDISNQINFLRGQIKTLCTGDMTQADHDAHNHKVRLIHSLQIELESTYEV